MKRLVLGGTVFVGRYVVEAARARGHRVIPEADPRFGGTLLADNRRAVAAGLTLTQVLERTRWTG